MQNKNPELCRFNESKKLDWAAKYGLVLFLKLGQLGKLDWICTNSEFIWCMLSMKA